MKVYVRVCACERHWLVLDICQIARHVLQRHHNWLFTWFAQLEANASCSLIAVRTEVVLFECLAECHEIDSKLTFLTMNSEYISQSEQLCWNVKWRHLGPCSNSLWYRWKYSMSISFQHELYYVKLILLIDNVPLLFRLWKTQSKLFCWHRYFVLCRQC